MMRDFPKINYLQVTHIPFIKKNTGEVITDELWANDLMAQVRFIGKMKIAAPQLVTDAQHQTWGPTATILPPDCGLDFIGFPPLFSHRDLWKLPSIRKVLYREVMWADLVHISNYFPPYLGLFYAHGLAVKQGKKTLLVIPEDFYDMMAWEWVRNAPTSFERWLRQKQLNIMERKVRKAAEKSSLTFLLTPPVVNLYRLIIKNGVAVRHTNHTTEDVITEKELEAKCTEIQNGAPLKIIAACRHAPLKGLDFLVHAIALLKKRNITVQCTIYGHGNITNDLKQLAKRLEVDDKVNIPGALQPGKSIFKAFAEAHVCAMPHRTNDFARSFYDAIAGGTPVIAFHTPASMGTIRDNVDGLLVPLDNVITLSLGIERLHNDRQLLTNLAMNARSRALVETQEAWGEYRAEKIKELFL